MNSTTLVLPTALVDTLLHLARRPLETGAVLLARRAALSKGGLRLIGVQLIEVTEDAYLARTDRKLTIASDGYMTALRAAEETGCVALWVHTHPTEGGTPRPSRRDKTVDEQLAGTFAIRTGSGLYGAMIFGHREGRLTFTGHLTGDHTTVIDRIFVVGERFALLRSFDSTLPELPSLHDRHVRAFGAEIPRVLAQLRIAIIGSGGTGSAVAEQLVRLGVRYLTLIDPDILSDSNVTRVYGSTRTDVGRHKVDVIADHLHRIANGLHITRVIGTVSQQHIAQQVVGADVVFGCTDDDAGRMRLSRFSYMYLTPLIDCGIQVSATGNGHVQDITGRVTVLHPGAACLICRNRVSAEIAAAQERSLQEQSRLEKEGYAPALPGTEPAVIAYTTATAAAAVNELLERLAGYGPTPPPSETLLRIHDRKTSSNDQAPTPGHYCADTDPLNIGDTARYWGLGWAA
ncbi:HesA/MoeB/ThiF family protein [Streptomyces phaeochromogenes]|uniref:HesA/MoeB/ThiF family protein n=1 Tax=Streptomyces phaeochromogenes TaxID=1923 RepID=UPI0037127974